MLSHLRLSVLSALLVSTLFAACSAETTDAPATAETPTPTSLREANIAPDFNFATTRAVSFHVKNELSATQSLEIRNPRNELLVRSSLASGQELVTDFPLPLGDTEVLIKLGDQQQKVAVVNNTLTATFH